MSFKYPWPASALTHEHMAALYRARQRSAPRIPINRLIAEAVVETYGAGPKPDAPTKQQKETR